MVPPATSTRHGQERRREILSTAVDVFGESGFAGARIDEVARRVGIQRPSILYHFPDKHALYAAAIGLVLREITDRIRATGTEPTERLEAIADAWVDFMITRPNAARLLLRQMLDAVPLAPKPTTDASESRDEIQTPMGALLGSIQSAIDDRASSESLKSLDATEFALILSSTSLVWFASRNAIEGTLGLDTLSPQSVQRHRRTLHSLIRQLLQATDGPPEPVSERNQKKTSGRHPLRALLLTALLSSLVANPVFPAVSAS